MPFSISARSVNKLRDTDAFVDDAELGLNDFWDDYPDLQDMLDDFEKAAQRWERLLFTSGGALEMKKCLWYCLYWHWDAEGREQATIFGKEGGPELQISRGMDKESKTAINRKEVTASRKTLGVRLEPMGLFNDEFDFLLTKAKRYATRLEASSLGSYDSLMFYKTSFLNGVGYSFPVVPLSFEAAKLLQTPMTKVLLNEISFNRNFSRAVAYGPLAFGGLAILTVYVEQGIAKVALIMRHMSSESELGKLITISLRAAQLEAGVSWDILGKPQTIPHMSNSWIKALMDFLVPHGIALKLCEDTKWQSYAATSDGDSFIMDHILQSNHFSDRELEDINRVRLFFRALTVSDIANAAGTMIDEMYLSLERPPQHLHSSWRWPQQPEITKKQWNLWEKAICLTLLNSYGKLRQRLGKWTKLTHRRYPWYYCPDEQVLMYRFVSADGVVYFDHHEARENGNGYETEPSERKNAREATSWVFYPTEVTDFGNQLQHTHQGCIVPPRATAATTFTGFVEKLSKPRRRLLAGLKLVHDDATYWIRHQWENEGLLVSATDGSAPEDGTFGWVLALPDGTALVECNGPADGAPDQMSSGRAETAGVLSLGQFFQAAAEYLEINPTGHCRNYIDSTAALRRAQRSSQPQRLLRSRISSDMDLTTARKAHIRLHLDPMD